MFYHFNNNILKDSTFKIEDRVSKMNSEKKKDSNNYDTIAWLRVEGTNIDYPIVYDKSNTYKNPIEKTAFGWLNSDNEKYKNNLTIDGHNLFNLGVPKIHSDKFYRFEELMAYSYYDFAKENQFIQLTMGGKEYLYQIFAVGFLYDIDFRLLPGNNVDKKEQQQHINFLKEKSIYKYDIDVDSNDNILNVATCTRMFGQDMQTNFVLSAKLVKDKKNTIKPIHKTKKYDKIELILKGSENDNEESM